MSALSSSPASLPIRSKQLDDALELRSRGRLAEAVEQLANPQDHDPDLYVNRGEMQFSLGRFQDAALSYLSVTISDPDNADAHFNLGLCLERCGHWDVASEAFQRVLRLQPERHDARLGLGACFLHMNRAEEALVMFQQCSTGAKAGPALIGTAAALQLLRRFEEAASAYDAMLRLDPDSEEALANLIALNIDAQHLERAQNLCQLLLAIRPQSTIALEGLATVAYRHSDHEAAASYCDRILEAAPDCTEAWHNLRIAIDRRSFRFPEPAAALESRGNQ